MQDEPIPYAVGGRAAQRSALKKCSLPMTARMLTIDSSPAPGWRGKVPDCPEIVFAPNPVLGSVQGADKVPSGTTAKSFRFIRESGPLGGSAHQWPFRKCRNSRSRCSWTVCQVAFRQPAPPWCCEFLYFQHTQA